MPNRQDAPTTTRRTSNHPLAAARRDAGLSQQQAGDAVGVSRSLVALCEGGYVPSRTVQEKIAAALGTTPAQVWPEEDR